MIQPTNLDISAFYSKKIGGDKTIFVNVYTSDMGEKIHIHVTSTGKKTGDFVVSPQQVEESTKFIQECSEAFKKIIRVNDAFKEDEEEK